MKVAAKDPWDYLGKVVSAAETLGSVGHREFAALARKGQGERSYAQYSLDTMETVLKAFAERNVNRAMAISTMRDMAPFIVGSSWWAQLGFPVISLTHDFFRAVAVTDFGDAGDEPLHMPFPAFVLRLPESLGGQEQATPLFIYPLPTKHVLRDGIGLPLYASPEGAEIQACDVKFGATRMSLTPEPGEGAERGSWTHWNNGIPVQHFLHGKVAGIDERDPIEAYVTSALGQSFDAEMTARARRVLGNTLLYINANGGLPAEKKVGAEVAVEREHSDPRFRVGRAIKLGAKLKNAIREGLRGGASWKLESRFVVRGHWRNQAYGPDRSLRRRQWISPFWKGPEDMGEALERTFEVT